MNARTNSLAQVSYDAPFANVIGAVAYYFSY